MENVSMYDTIKLIAEGVRGDRMRDGWECTIDKDGEVKRYSVRHYLNKAADGKYSGTVGLEYIPHRSQLITTVSSLPVLAHGTALKPFTQADIVPTFATLQGVVSPYIDIDIFSESYISRLDNSTFYLMSQPVCGYISLLSSITMENAFRARKYSYDQQTVEYRQKSMKVGFYDKVASEKSKERYIPEGLDGANVLRNETQARNTAKVRQLWKLPEGYRMKPSDLLNDCIAERTLKMRGEMFDRYFRKQQGTVALPNPIDAKMIGELFTGKQRKSAADIQLHLANGMRPEDIVRHYENTGMSVSTLRRHRNLIYEVAATLTESGDLYEEMRSVIMKEVEYAKN